MRSWARLVGMGAMKVVTAGFWVAAAGCRNDVKSLEARHVLPTSPIANTHALCESARAQRCGEILRAPRCHDNSHGPRGPYAVARAHGRRSPRCVNSRLHRDQFLRWTRPLCHHYQQKWWGAVGWLRAPAR